MIELIGSEKQVAWANDIRAKNIKRLEDELEKLKKESAWHAEQGYPGVWSKTIAAIEKALPEIGNQKPDAKWWIENKGVANEFIERVRRLEVHGK